ncbi:HNH endonuclease [Geodermatophilus sp. SYSU D00691]
MAAELGWPARDVPDAVVHAVEAEVLPRAGELSVRRLRELIRARLLAHDVDLSERRRKDAEELAHVRVAHHRDGMSELIAFLPTASATACADAVDQYARMLKADGDTRPIGLLRALVLEDLILRPWDTSRPPVTAQLHLTAPVRATRADATDVADLDGQPITGALLRDLLEQLDAVCPGGLQAPAGGALHLSLVDPVSGKLRAVVDRAQLAKLAARGCPDHPAGDCSCPVLESPGTVDRYRPSPGQYEFVRTRDRGCRWPGCPNTAAWADLDHVVPHACGGETACDNLCCLCRRHHRIKTHDRRWGFRLDPDGTFSVTTPAGVTRTSRPPGLAPPTRPPPALPDQPPF